MAGQQPAFSFGSFGKTPTTSASSDSNTAPKSLFGGGSTTTPTSLFGNNTVSSGGQSNPTSTTSPNPFGGATSGAQTPSLFGSGTGQTSNPFGGVGGSTSGASMFGGGNKPPSTGFSFGKPEQSSQTSGPTQSSLPSFGTPNKTPASSNMSNLFGKPSQPDGSKPEGSTTPAHSQPSGMFGVPSTTPAGPPPQGSSGPSLFGSKPQGQDSQPSTNLFGNLQKPSMFGVTKSSEPATNTPSAPAGSLFSQPPNSGNLFGAKATSQHDAANPTVTSRPAFSFPSSAASEPASLASTQKPLFGAPPATTQPQKSVFGAPPATTQSTMQKPLFGPTPTTTEAPKSLFGTTPASTQPTTTATTTSNMFGSLGGVSSAPAASSAAPTTTSGPSLFGAPVAGLGTSAPSSQPGTTAPNPNLFSSLLPGTSAAATSATTQAGANAAIGPGTNISGLSASTAGPAPQGQSRLKNKTMDEIITRWASDLTKYQKEFQSQAEKVSQWDRLLVENSEKIQKLYGRALDAERATSEVEKQLTSVENQQAELSHWLDRYERDVEEMMSRQVGQGDSLQGPDQERERTYKLAEKLSERLDDMGKDLSTMIEEINGASEELKTTKADEPITHIVRILNSHLSQLQQIDQGTAALQAKVSAAQKESQGLLLPGGQNGMGSTAAEDFYRSYLGRR